MDPASLQPIYHIYTIFNAPDNSISPALDNNASTQNIYDMDEEGNPVVYIALHQETEEDEEDIEEVEEEEEEEEENSFTQVDDNESVTQLNMTNVKLITLENGEMYLTTTTDNSLEDNLTSVEPHLITNIKEETPMAAVEESEEIQSLDDENGAFHKIQLPDGTCAIVNEEFWNSINNSLPVNDLVPEEPEVKKKKCLCPYVGCTKMFSTAHHLSVHYRSHTGSRPYACTEEGCDKTFSTGYSLKAHFRTHTGEKPYGCSLCDKRFKTSGDLQKHFRTHTGEKPFMCPIEGCGKSFTTSNIRKVHIRSHTGERPYTCKVVNCGKAFASATNYKNHMRIHSGEKPYACPVEGCGKRFTEYSSLYKHHTVHAPYEFLKCKFCPQRFKTEGVFRCHLKTVHNIIQHNIGEASSLTNDRSFALQFSDIEEVHRIDK